MLWSRAAICAAVSARPNLSPSDCCVVHQVLHLIQIGTDAVDITASSLVEHVITDIAGFKCGITEEAVIVFRMQVQTVEEVCRAEEFILIGTAKQVVVNCLIITRQGP
jgi:hypothetical protein